MKTYCKMKRDDMKKAFVVISDEVRAPRHICKKCMRASKVKGRLCKPVGFC